MRKEEYCNLVKLALGPATEHAEAARRAGGIRQEILAHLETCEECEAALESANCQEEAYEFWEALGSGDEDEAYEIDRLLQANAESSAMTATAVADCLLPTLPKHSQQSFTVLQITHLALFSALDAIRMTVGEVLRCSDSTEDAFCIVNVNGDVTANGPDVFSAVPVVARMAGLSSDEAEAVVAWIVNAARSFPRTIPGLLASPTQNGAAISATVTAYTPGDSLAKIWSSTSRKVARPIHLGA